MKSNKKEEQGQEDFFLFKEQFFDFFLYYLPEFSQKAEDRKEGEKSLEKEEKLDSHGSQCIYPIRGSKSL